MAFWNRKRMKAKGESAKTEPATDSSVADVSVTDVSVTDWEEKYRAEHEAFERYRGEVAYADEKRRKEEAYASLLGECGIGEKYRGRLVGLCDLDSVILDADGRITGREELAQRISEEWGDLITPSSVPVATPPTLRGQALTKESIMAIRDRDARRALILENMELFG